MYVEMSESGSNEFKVYNMSDYENCEVLEFGEEDDDGIIDILYDENDDYIVFDLESGE